MIPDEWASGHEAAKDAHRILVVTAVDERADVLRNSLEAEGLGWVVAVSDARKALPAFHGLNPDVVVVDTWPQHTDTISVIRQLDGRVPDDGFLPFVVLGSSIGQPKGLGALDVSIPVFYHGPDAPTPLGTDIRRLLAIRDRRFRVGFAAEQTMDTAHHIEYETATRLAQVAQLKDHDSQDHVFRVGRLASLVAARMRFDAHEVERIRAAAPLHDIGMIGIADAIRLKEGALSLEELDIIKTHTALGARLLSGGASALFRMAEEIALYHHENWDGTGYTPGLEGESIPVAARIVRVVDLFDAVTRPRAFQHPWTRAEAIQFLRDRSARFFDPDVVGAFLEACAHGEDDAPDGQADRVLTD